MSFEQDNLKLIENQIAGILGKEKLSESDVNVVNQLFYLRDRLVNPSSLGALANAARFGHGSVLSGFTSLETRAKEDIPVLIQGLQAALVHVENILDLPELYEFAKEFADKYEEAKLKEGYVPVRTDPSGFMYFDKATSGVVENPGEPGDGLEDDPDKEYSVSTRSVSPNF